MATGKTYRTKQRQNILQALQNMPANHATAEDLLDYLKQNGEEVGLATVYRTLDKLVNENIVIKYTLPDGMRACYQFLESCDLHSSHFHVICTGCGQITHLECEEVNFLSAHLLAHHHIQLDTQKTIFYGLCEECSQIFSTNQK